MILSACAVSESLQDTSNRGPCSP